MDSMSLNRRIDKRFDKTINAVTGLITNSEGVSRQPFLLRDISETGFGLWVNEEIKENTIVKITLDQTYGCITLDCDVMWAVKRSDGNGFHCGIQVKEEEHILKNLYQLFNVNN